MTNQTNTYLGVSIFCQIDKIEKCLENTYNIELGSQLPTPPAPC